MPRSIENSVYKRAISYLNAATDREDRYDWDGAFQLYSIALDLLMQCVKESQDATEKSRIRALMSTYLDKAELMKKSKWHANRVAHAHIESAAYIRFSLY